MQVELHYRPANTAAKVSLRAGESCTAESGAMIAMSGDMDITTTTHKRGSGGLLRAVKRKLAGESLFLNHFHPKGESGEVWLGTDLAGDMIDLQLNKENLIVQSGSFLCCEESIDIDMGWQGFKSVFSGESIFWLNLSGHGKVVLSAFGAIYPVAVNGEYIVDTGHIVAFEESLEFVIDKAGKSWWHSFLGGEGLVCKFYGRGTIWCQSHNPKSFGASLTPGLIARKA